MISLIKIAQIQNLGSVFNLVIPSPNTRFLFYFYFISRNNLINYMFKRFFLGLATMNMYYYYYYVGFSPVI